MAFFIPFIAAAGIFAAADQHERDRERERAREREMEAQRQRDEMRRQQQQREEEERQREIARQNAIRQAEAQRELERQRYREEEERRRREEQQQREAREKQRREEEERRARQLAEQQQQLMEQKRLMEQQRIEEQKNQERMAFESFLACVKRITPNIPNDFKSKNNIAMFGETSVGKSTLVNVLMNLEGEERAKVGMGETTRRVTPYVQRHGTMCCWDFPGRNDECSYFHDSDHVQLIKSMNLAVVMFTATARSMTKVMQFLESMGVPFIAVISKVDMLTQYDDNGVQHLKAMVDDATAVVSSFKMNRGVVAISSKHQNASGSEWSRFQRYLINAQYSNRI